MKKAVLRKLYLDKRKKLSPEEYQAKNQLLLRQCMAFFSSTSFQAVHCFLPIIHQKEPDTWPLIRALQAQGITVVVSRSDMQTNALYHHPLTQDTVLQTNRWGIPEPASAEIACFPPEKIDAIIVPLLAFDKSGHRVGYGKGYYDRFLAQCRPDAAKIGISIESPVEQIEDADNQLDIKLDYCMAPDRIWSF